MRSEAGAGLGAGAQAGTGAGVKMYPCLKRSNYTTEVMQPTPFERVGHFELWEEVVGDSV